MDILLPSHTQFYEYDELEEWENTKIQHFTKNIRSKFMF